MPHEPHNAPGLLAPYRVLDLTDESGFLAGKILADLGADVVKIEPPGGDGARRVGPFAGDQLGPDRSLYWLSYNTGKRGITLNLHTPAGQDLFRRLAARADFVFETYPPGALEALGVGYPQLRALSPRLVWTAITPFGQSGPYRDYKGSDLVVMAMSGMMSLMGEPGHPPLRVSLPQSPMWAGMYAAAGALVAHHYRQASGLGQLVDISLQAALLWALANAPAFWATNRTVPRRAGQQVTGRSLTGATMRAIYPCKDGYLNFIIYGGDAGRRSNESLVAWMAEEGLAPDGLLHKDWARFNIAESTQAEIDELERPTAELFRRYTKAEFLDQAFRRDMLGYPVSDARDILADEHLAARGLWHTVEFPALGSSFKFPGSFARFSAAPVGACRPAPRVGEHNRAVYQDELGLSGAELARLGADGVI